MPRMFSVTVGLVAALLVTSEPVAVAQPPADAEAKVAAKRPVSMAKPKPAGRGLVLLQGRVSDSSSRVVLQRSADGRWVKVRSVPVQRHGYQVVVPTRPKQQRFRARAGKETSQIRIVSAAHPTKTQDACGKRPRKPDGSRWACTFADDFDATKLDRSHWLPHTTFVSGPSNGNRACYRDHPDNISVARGTLRLTVLRLAAPVTCARPNLSSAYVSGMVSTYRKFSQRYGLFEARFKVTATREPGLQEAFWMWPDDRQDIPEPWPAAGEIDVVETYSGNPDLAIPFLHYTFNDNGGPRPGVNTAWDCKAKRGVFNTYTLEWSADRIEISVNGDSCLINTSGNHAFKRRYILALTQALGTGSNRYVGDAPLPATMTVDYVRVWE